MVLDTWHMEAIDSERCCLKIRKPYLSLNETPSRSCILRLWTQKSESEGALRSKLEVASAQNWMGDGLSLRFSIYIY